MSLTALPETSTFDTTVFGPTDGDPANGDEFQAGLKNLANRTRFLKDQLLFGVKKFGTQSGDGNPATTVASIATANVDTFADAVSAPAILPAVKVGHHILVIGQAVVFPSSTGAIRTYAADLTIQSTSQAQTRMIGSYSREEIPVGGNGLRRITIVGYWPSFIEEDYTAKIRLAYDTAQGSFKLTGAWALMAVALNPGP